MNEEYHITVLVYDDEVGHFYEDVVVAIESYKTPYSFIIGDLNAKVGKKE